MRRLLLLLLPLALTGCASQLATAGYDAGGGIGGDVSAHGHLSAAEMRWVARYGDWELAASPCNDADYEPGPPPGTRLRAAWGELAAACRRTGHAPEALVAALDDAIVHRSFAGWSPPRGIERGATRTDPVLTGVARDLLAGWGSLPDGVAVRCYSYADWRVLAREMGAAFRFPLDRVHGFVYGLFPGVVFLSPEACAELDAMDALADEPENAYLRDEAGWGVTALAHETVHLTGVLNEARTECVAMQRVGQTAELLGLPAEQGAALQRLVWERHYPHMPARYRTPACHDGGPFDVHPESPRFP